MADKTVKQIELRTSAPGADQVPGAFARIGREMEDLKRSTKGINDVVGLIKGGGAMMGVSLATNTLAGFAEAMRDIKNGSISAEEGMIGFLKGLPSIFGDAARTTDALYDLATGFDKVADAARKAEMKQQTADFASGFTKLVKMEADLERQSRRFFMSPADRARDEAEERFGIRTAGIEGAKALASKSGNSEDMEIAKTVADKAMKASREVLLRELFEVGKKERAELFDRAGNAVDAIKGFVGKAVEATQEGIQKRVEADKKEQEFIANFIEGFQERAKENAAARNESLSPLGPAAAIEARFLTGVGAGGSPVQRGVEATAKNTSTTNTKLDQLIAAVRAGGPGVVAATGF